MKRYYFPLSICEPVQRIRQHSQPLLPDVTLTIKIQLIGKIWNCEPRIIREFFSIEREIFMTTNGYLFLMRNIVSAEMGQHCRERQVLKDALLHRLVAALCLFKFHDTAVGHSSSGNFTLVVDVGEEAILVHDDSCAVFFDLDQNLTV